ncbi:MAG: putative membrane protein [Hydrogenibacillus schlegelii]|uniref:Putative membrane protein n=2 Tax=Hydrogenibacillus schlegelii TaxID=1484 RepID=A0A2T5GBL6_HYDSH|nr:MAG: putative membrane protein [Hydrogenibacillus schlegelii]
MMRCPQCGFENEPNARFCAECGAPLPAPDPPASDAPQAAEPVNDRSPSAVEAASDLRGETAPDRRTNEPPTAAAGPTPGAPPGIDAPAGEKTGPGPSGGDGGPAPSTGSPARSLQEMAAPLFRFLQGYAAALARELRRPDLSDGREAPAAFNWAYGLVNMALFALGLSLGVYASVQSVLGHLQGPGGSLRESIVVFVLELAGGGKSLFVAYWLQPFILIALYLVFIYVIVYLVFYAGGRPYSFTALLRELGAPLAWPIVFAWSAFVLAWISLPLFLLVAGLSLFMAGGLWYRSAWHVQKEGSGRPGARTILLILSGFSLLYVLILTWAVGEMRALWLLYLIGI